MNPVAVAATMAPNEKKKIVRPATILVWLGAILTVTILIDMRKVFRQRIDFTNDVIITEDYRDTYSDIRGTVDIRISIITKKLNVMVKFDRNVLATKKMAAEVKATLVIILCVRVNDIIPRLFKESISGPTTGNIRV